MSDARPPSRPPPSQGSAPDDPAPSPPSRPPPSRSAATAREPSRGNPPSTPAPEAAQSDPPTRSPRRRRVLVALSALVALAIVAIGVVALRSSDGRSLDDRIDSYADFVDFEVDKVRERGACALVNGIESRLVRDSGQLVRVQSDWSELRVFAYVYWIELLLDRLGPNPRTLDGPLVSGGSDAATIDALESRWDDVGFELELGNWQVDDGSIEALSELSDLTLATLATAPFAADCSVDDRDAAGADTAAAATSPTVDEATSARWVLEGQTAANPSPARAELWLGPPVRVDPALSLACDLDPATDAVLPARVTLTNLSSSSDADLGFGLQRRDRASIVVASAMDLATGPRCRTADDAFDLLVSFDFRNALPPGDDATGRFEIVVRDYFSSPTGTGDAPGLAGVELKPVLVIDGVAVDNAEAELTGPFGTLPPPLQIVPSLS